MERRIRRLGIALVVLFTLVFGQLAYVQVFAADDIRANPANFSRQLIAEYNVERGKIITTGGLVIAESVPAPGGSRYRYERRYPQGDLYGYITGYYSRIYGRSALEESMNTYLSGEAPELAISTFTDLLLGNEKRGANVFVTIDPNLQETARTALGSNEGAVVAMDPGTGDILALYSTPGFDPSELSSGSDDEMRRAWNQLNADPEKPLLALSHQELFLPGSSFKIVTASAALENGFGPDSVWPNPHRLTLPLTNEELQNFGDDHCNGGSSQITMIEAFEESCNVTFAEIGARARSRTGIAGAGPRVRPVRHAPARANDVRRAARPVRAPVPERAGSRSPSTSSRTIRSSRSPRSGWTTTWSTRCRWR